MKIIIYILLAITYAVISCSKTTDITSIGEVLNAETEEIPTDSSTNKIDTIIHDWIKNDSIYHTHTQPIQ